MRWIDRAREVYGRLSGRSAGESAASADPAEARDSTPPDSTPPGSPVLSIPPTILVTRIRELSPAEIRARELEADYSRQMMIENTPTRYYNDTYRMDDFPEVGEPAPSDVAEQALMRHLHQHPELREIPRWAPYYREPQDWAGADYAASYRAEREQAIFETANHIGVAQAKEALYLESLRQEHRCGLPVEHCADCLAEERLTDVQVEDRLIELAAAERVIATAVAEYTGTNGTHQTTETGGHEEAASAARVVSAAFQPAQSGRLIGDRAVVDGTATPPPIRDAPAATPRQDRQTGLGRS